MLSLHFYVASLHPIALKLHTVCFLFGPPPLRSSPLKRGQCLPDVVNGERGTMNVERLTLNVERKNSEAVRRR